MKDILREPIELIDEDLDTVAGGGWGGVHISSSPIQVNNSVNAVSTGNNNNNGSGNLAAFVIVED
jgi:hypothetical protein